MNTKLLFLASAIAYISIACTEKVVYNDSYTSDLQLNNNPYEVSIEDARAELVSFLEDIDTQTKSKSEQRTIKNSFSTGGFVTTKSSGSEGEPYVHVFNFDDNRGFALVSGDTRVPSILCCTDKGNLTPDSVIDNPGVIMYLSNLDTYYRMLVGLPITISTGEVLTYDDYKNDITTDNSNGLGTIKPADPIPPYYTYEYGDWTITETGGNLLECHWHQEDPYNKYCFTDTGEQALVGCVAIAVGQIMYYWGNSISFPDLNLDWDFIKNNSTSPESEDIIARLLAKLGEPQNLDMDYGTKLSGAIKENVPRTFMNFQYESGGSFSDYDVNLLIDALQYRPVYGRGNAKKHITTTKFLGIKIKETVSYSEGHAWIYDGYLTRSREEKKYNYEELVQTNIKVENLIHINWGWGGNCDGYFSPYELYSKNPVVKGSSTVTEGTDYYFQYNLQMNTGINPGLFLE